MEGSLFCKMADGQYSFSLTTFSPSGKLVQIEYALNRVQQGAPALGIKARNGVVLAAEKKLATQLLESDTINKVDNFTPSVGCVYAGMPADFRVVLKKGRKEVTLRPWPLILLVIGFYLVYLTCSFRYNHFALRHAPDWRHQFLCLGKPAHRLVGRVESITCVGRLLCFCVGRQPPMSSTTRNQYPQIKLSSALPK